MAIARGGSGEIRRYRTAAAPRGTSRGLAALVARRDELSRLVALGTPASTQQKAHREMQCALEALERRLRTCPERAA